MKPEKNATPECEPNAEILSEEEMKQVDGGYVSARQTLQWHTLVTIPNGSNKYQYEKPIPTNKP